MIELRLARSELLFGKEKRALFCNNARLLAGLGPERAIDRLSQTSKQ
jgi:hypothetical protein